MLNKHFKSSPFENALQKSMMLRCFPCPHLSGVPSSLVISDSVHDIIHLLHSPDLNCEPDRPETIGKGKPHLA